MSDTQPNEENRSTERSLAGETGSVFWPDFPTWNIRFSNRETFNRAILLCEGCDIGHSDMVLTFADREDYNANRVGLLAAGISDFTTEKPSSPNT